MRRWVCHIKKAIVQDFSHPPSFPSYHRHLPCRPHFRPIGDNNELEQTTEGSFGFSQWYRQVQFADLVEQNMNVLANSVMQPQSTNPLAGFNIELDSIDRPRSVSPFRPTDAKGVELVKQLHAKVNALPKTIPKAKSDHPFARFNAKPMDPANN